MDIEAAAAAKHIILESSRRQWTGKAMIYTDCEKRNKSFNQKY
jgi:hypothetical protein